VSTTGAPLWSRWFDEDESMTFRKNTVAALESPACVPDARLTCDEVSFENPVPDSSDQRTFVFASEEGLEPMERTHAWVALTFSDRPCVEGLRLPALTAETEVAENEATCTFTREGTVTLTVCVRLLVDPRCATAPLGNIALPIAITSSERRIPTIYRAPVTVSRSSAIVYSWVRHNMYLAL
jgi:hypothetical protein